MASELVLRQLEPPRRVVHFRHEAAPKKGLTEGTEVRGEAAYVKGRTEGRARLDGSQELPVEYEFDLRQRYLEGAHKPFELEGQDQITVPQVVGNVMREMVRETVTVLVQFEGEEYVGYLESVEVERPQRGESTRRLMTVTIKPIVPQGLSFVRRAPLASDPTDLVSEMREVWVGFLGRVRVPLNSLRTRIESAQRAANLINTGLSEAIAVVEEGRDLVTDGVGVAQSSVGALGNVQRGAEQFRQALAITPQALVQSDDPKQVLLAMEMQADTDRTMRQLRHLAGVEKRRLELQDRGDLIGVHVAIAGEDLRLLAFNVYGSASHWVQVAQFNGLRGSELTGGQRVLLPRIDQRGVS